MPKRRYLNLMPEEKLELEHILDHHEKPYMREKAAAMLKIEAGMSPHAVALTGLLKPRDPDTVYNWLDQYEAEGIEGWLVKPGRGRKAAYASQYSDPEDAKTALLMVVRRNPVQFGYQCSRWTLEMIIEACTWLALTTTAGLSQVLQRLGISYKRGRDHVHSPDENYVEKLSLVELMRLRAYYGPERYAFLYLDELTFYRQPTLARAYEAMGAIQPLAHRSHRSNTHSRILGALNAITGQVNYRQRSRTDIACLSGFWYDLRRAYPDPEQIYVVVDNWPVHFHPDVLAPLQPQHFPFPPKLPANWPTTPSSKAKVDNLPIQLLCLPTYASWLNPIEKLWRWLKQEVLHLHRLSDAWPELKLRVDHFLNLFAQGSTELLFYVGLLPI